MGKEGGYWGGGRSLKRAEPESPGCISSFFHFFDFHPFHFSFQHHNHQPQQQQQQQPQPSFNFDHTTASSISEGTQAPRNSLESEDAPIMGVGSSISTKQENLEIPKKNKLFIKTSTGIISGNSKVGNIVNDNLSPGTKTPTLVARLMGLDLLPDSQSPSSSSPSSSSTTTSSYLSSTKSQVNLHQQHHHHHHFRPRQHRNVVVTKPRRSMDDSIAASRFLSDTPRISSARISDVDHRLSLQFNKENMGVGGEYLELPRFSFSKLKFEEQCSGNKSPRQYAKQIVKQVRERVLMNGKVGTDVTNTVKNTERGGGEIFVCQFRCKKSPRTTPTCSSSDELRSSPGKVSNNGPSCSPRIRFMDPKNIISTVTTAGKDPIPPKPPVKFDNNQPQVVSEAIVVEQEAHHQFQKQKSSLVPKCKKAANEKFSPRLKKPNNVRNKQDESFVRPLLSSSCDKKSTSGISKRSSQPLLINLLNLNSAVKNTNSNISPPAATTKIPQKQKTQESVARDCCSSQLSSGSSQTYTRKEEATSPSSPACITLSTTATGESKVDELDKRKISVYGSMFNDSPEFEYVSSILSSTGFAVKKGTTKTNISTVSVSLFRQWLSPTQPLDPSIFHHLEQQFQNQNQNQNHQNQKNYPTCDASSVSSQDRSLRPKYDVGVRCNRRLLFDLVNETLLDVVGPCDEEAVWERIGRLQRDKKCEVQEDIDALIEMEDLGKTMMKMKSAEELVAEIEGNIMDTLLHETVMMATECVAAGAWW